MLNKLRAAFPEFDWMRDPNFEQSSIEVPHEGVMAPLGDKFVLLVWGPKTLKGPCYHAYLQCKKEHKVFGGKLLVHVPSCFSPVKAMEAMQLQIAMLDTALDAFEAISGFKASSKEAPMSENNPKIHYGKKVRVSAQLDARDYTPIGIQKRRPGATGIIIAHSDSHGLCFEVDHEDGSSGWYDPEELMEAKTVYAPLTNDPPTGGTQNGGDDVTDCDGCINHCENDGGDPHCLAFGLDLIGQWTIGAGGPIGMRCSECRKQNAGLSTCQISERVFDVSGGSAVFMDAD